MKAILQRVKQSKVLINNDAVGSINNGLLILLGIKGTDSTDDINILIHKIVNLRIFEDENSKFNLSLLDIKGEILIVSQFTLYADCKKGRRPSFTEAAPINKAKELYELFVNSFKNYYPSIKIETGVFQEKMLVQIENDGPVTIVLDSEELK